MMICQGSTMVCGSLACGWIYGRFSRRRNRSTRVRPRLSGWGWGTCVRYRRQQAERSRPGTRAVTTRGLPRETARCGTRRVSAGARRRRTGGHGPSPRGWWRWGGRTPSVWATRTMRCRQGGRHRRRHACALQGAWHGREARGGRRAPQWWATWHWTPGAWRCGQGREMPWWAWCRSTPGLRSARSVSPSIGGTPRCATCWGRRR